MICRVVSALYIECGLDTGDSLRCHQASHRQPLDELLRRVGLQTCGQLWLGNAIPSASLLAITLRYLALQLKMRLKQSTLQLSFSLPLSPSILSIPYSHETPLTLLFLETTAPHSRIIKTLTGYSALPWRTAIDMRGLLGLSNSPYNIQDRVRPSSRVTSIRLDRQVSRRTSVTGTILCQTPPQTGQHSFLPVQAARSSADGAGTASRTSSSAPGAGPPSPPRRRWQPRPTYKTYP